MKLSIILPALNEEEAVGRVVQECLEAAECIKTDAGVDQVEVIVVDDGSRDKTAEIVRAYPDAVLLSHERNLGYGRALKTGFERASGELLAFLDADGSCPAQMLAKLCQEMLEQDADIAVGSRFGPESKMPIARKVGNRLFARLLSVLSHQRITDSASGMRVFRRELLPMVMALPNGLHFTPAMTSIATFEESVKIIELPVPYGVRAGKSKLRVISDGLAFLRTIVGIGLTYNPLLLFGTAGLVCLVVAALLVVLSMLGDGQRAAFLLPGSVALFSTALTLVTLGLFSSYTVTLLTPSRVFSGSIGRHLIREPVFSRFHIVGSVLFLVGAAGLAWSLLGYAGMPARLRLTLFLAALFSAVCGTQLGILGIMMILLRNFHKKKESEALLRSNLNETPPQRKEEHPHR